ncbi:MAG TPA: protease modulator HflK [Phycisphaerae bacterium]|nr:protease modulator HflK [Phycisphaerae bacterium]
MTTSFPEGPPPSPPSEPRSDLALPVSVDTDGGSRWGKAHHVLLFFVAAATAVWLLSGFYKVKADEVAVVERLGAFLGTGEGGKAMLVEQGLHYHIPWPIDQVFMIPVQQTRTLTVNAFFAPQEEYADFKRDLMRENPNVTPEWLSALFDPYLITSDKNVVHMSIAVTYQIDDPEAWIMSVSHESEAMLTAGAATTGQITDGREALLQQVVQHAMVRQLAHIPIDNVLFEGSDKVFLILQNAIQKAMQIPDPDLSDPTSKRVRELGIQVQKVDVTGTRWPQYQMVNDAFQSVLRSKSEADGARFAAQSRAEAAKTQATSQRETMLRDAEAYAKQVTDEAQGEANRFSQVYAQYQKAPDVTRWNVFAEAAKSVSTNAKRILFVQPGQKTILTIDPPTFDAGQVQTNK